MASPQHPATMEKLPGYVLSKIFMRLLAKQLAQMRCISKSWNALLSQSSFIKSHLHRSIHNNDEILLVFNAEFPSNSESLTHPKPFTAHPSRSPDIELTDFIKLPVIPQFEDKRVVAIGSVNGLICFSHGNYPDSVIYIWNPSLSALLSLPSYSIPSHGGQPWIFLRFGFDPRTDDYKVVKVISLLRPPANRASEFSIFSSLTSYVVEEWLHVEVYSMRKGSWKPITKRPPSHITWFFEQDDVCVDGHDGHLHWPGYIGEDKRQQRIVAFDLGAETFSEMLLPSAIQNFNVYRGWNKLGVLAGKICVMTCLRDGGLEVWVMDEYGVADSWFKHNVLSQFSADIMKPYGFTSHGEFLFEKDEPFYDSAYDVGGGLLALYDPIASNTKVFKICAETDDTKYVEYVDSLVWVAPTESELSISRLQV